MEAQDARRRVGLDCVTVFENLNLVKSYDKTNPNVFLYFDYGKNTGGD